MCSMMNHSSDDGARLLWLEFRGPGGEEELDMGKNPKVGDVKISRTVFFICWQSTDQLVDQSTSQSVKRLVFRINSVDSNKCWKTICNIFQNSLENCWRRVIVAIGRQPFDLLGYLGKPGKGINLLSKILNFNVFSTKQPILEYTKQKIFWRHKWDFFIGSFLPEIIWRELSVKCKRQCDLC